MIFRWFELLSLLSTFSDCHGSSALFEGNSFVGLLLYSGIFINNVVCDVTGVGIEEGLLGGVFLRVF